jgi:DNA gyrase subunit B
VRHTPPKLHDCQFHGTGSGAELFIVEGDSASAAVARLCNPQLQAVLPMQGKPLNAVKASAQKVAQNTLFQALLAALGTGCGDQFELNQLRYQRVLLLMDPDADGIHCGALMLMFFHKHLPALLAGGHIYLVRAPVGEVVDLQTGEIRYAFIESEFVALCGAQLRANPARFNARRYRGLAGISPSQLAHFCVNPDTRRAVLMGLGDGQMAADIFNGARIPTRATSLSL